MRAEPTRGVALIPTRIIHTRLVFLHFFTFLFLFLTSSPTPHAHHPRVRITYKYFRGNAINSHEITVR